MRGSRSLGAHLRDISHISILTLDTLIWSKRTVFMLIVSLLVVSMAVLSRLVMSFRWIGAPFTPAQAFGVLMSTAVIHFLVVFVSLFYGTALISEEVEGKTLTYLFTRPIPKPAVMMGKYLCLAWVGAVLILPTVLACYLILYLDRDLTLFFQDVPLLAKDIGIVFLAILAYGALFSLLGAWLKHSILAGLFYAFGWEGLISYLPGFTRKLTVTHYVQSVFPHDDMAAAIAMMIGDRTPPLEAVLTLILMAALFLATACLVLREKEYVFDQ